MSGMNRVGIYYAYWERDWAADFASYPARAARLGFDVLELKLSQVMALPAQRRADLRAAVRGSGIEISFVDALRQENDVSSPDSAVRARGIEHVKRGLGVIAEMGGTVLGGIIYGAWGTPSTKEPAKDEHLARSVESMRAIASTAEDLGIVCCVEAVNRFEQFLLNTCAEAGEYVNAVASPNVKIMLDTFHMNIEEDSIRGAVLHAGTRLGHLHIGETNRRPPGQGRFPWAELAGALQEIAYPGRIVMEPFVQSGGEVGRDIRVWRDLGAGRDLDEEARQALRFVRGLFASPAA